MMRDRILLPWHNFRVLWVPHSAWLYADYFTA